MVRVTVEMMEWRLRVMKLIVERMFRILKTESKLMSKVFEPT